MLVKCNAFFIFKKLLVGLIIPVLNTFVDLLMQNSSRLAIGCYIFTPDNLLNIFNLVFITNF